MRRRSPAAWLPWLLGILSILVLWMLSQETLAVHNSPQFVIIIVGLIAFVVNVEVPLHGDAMSLGYAAGLLVYLTLDTSQPFPPLLVIAFGGRLGGLPRPWWRVRGPSASSVHFNPSRVA